MPIREYANLPSYVLYALVTGWGKSFETLEERNRDRLEITTFNLEIHLKDLVTLDKNEIVHYQIKFLLK